MAFIICFLVISTLATVAPAAVKRDDYASPVSNSQSASGSSSPVYSPSASSATYSQPANSNGYAVSGSNVPYSAAQTGYPGTSGSAVSAQSSAVNDHVASASNQNTFQASPAQSNGNLYYYYYPVQGDKNKDSANGYQAAASNQYSSSVNPVSSSDASGNSHLDTSSSSASSGSSPDLSYSAQEAYSQALSPGLNDYQAQAQASNNYDQTLSSITQLAQQYANYGSNNQPQYSTQGNNAQVSSFSGQNNNYGSGNFAYDASAMQQGQEQAGQLAASNPVPNYGVNPNQAQFIPASPGQQGPVSFNPAAFAQQYQQQIPFGSYPSGSMPQPSFDTSAASGYRRLGIGSFLMPMLALAGLSLLIPTVTSLTASGRKKRSTDGDVRSHLSQRIQYYQNLYNTAIEKEECMNRIICELGGAVSDVRGKSPLFADVSFKVLEKLVPAWMGNSVDVFKRSAFSNEEGKCREYSCEVKK